MKKNKICIIFTIESLICAKLWWLWKSALKSSDENFSFRSHKRKIFHFLQQNCNKSKFLLKLQKILWIICKKSYQIAIIQRASEDIIILKRWMSYDFFNFSFDVVRSWFFFFNRINDFFCVNWFLNLIFLKIGN